MQLLLTMPGSGNELLGYLLMAVLTVVAAVMAVGLFSRFLRNRYLEKELEKSNRKFDQFKNEIL